MDLNQLTSISPIDGRYHAQTKEFAEHFSEWGLIKFRILVEIEYFSALCEHPLPQLKTVDSSSLKKLKKVVREFSLKEAIHIKKIEERTNHDVGRSESAEMVSMG